MPQITVSNKPDCRFDSQWASDVTEQLNLLEEKMNHILNDLHGNLPIIPELAAQLRRTARLTHFIDTKVVDQPKPKPKGN